MEQLPSQHPPRHRAAEPRARLARALITAALASAAPAAAEPETERGAALYAEHCASCHGADLKGQPNWREPGPDGRLPAPPHDASGHTWHHSDALLVRIIRDGTAAVVGGGYESDMPGFGDVLSEADITAILDFLKSRWPERERSWQEEVSRDD
jgi:mono/diheme cytochrome c family protein